MLDCISLDGRYLKCSIQRWQCPRCLRVIQADTFRTYQPNTTCGCEIAHGIQHQMVDLGASAPPGYRYMTESEKTP